MVLESGLGNLGENGKQGDDEEVLRSSLTPEALSSREGTPQVKIIASHKETFNYFICL